MLNTAMPSKISDLYSVEFAWVFVIVIVPVAFSVTDTMM